MRIEKSAIVLILFNLQSTEDFEKPQKTSVNTTKVYKEESLTRSKSKSSTFCNYVILYILHFPPPPSYAKKYRVSSSKAESFMSKWLSLAKALS